MTFNTIALLLKYEELKKAILDNIFNNIHCLKKILFSGCQGEGAKISFYSLINRDEFLVQFLRKISVPKIGISIEPAISFKFE
jgi:hypothetical protein